MSQWSLFLITVFGVLSYFWCYKAYKFVTSSSTDQNTTSDTRIMVLGPDNKIICQNKMETLSKNGQESQLSSF